MKKLVILSLTSILSFGAVASEKDLEGLMDVYKVTYDDQKNEVISKALDASNGDLLEYKITYKNNSEKTFEDVSVIGKIPSTTTLIKDSEMSFNINGKEMVSAKYSPLYSVDGGATWSEKPTKKVVKDGKIVEVESKIEDFNMVKWDIKSFNPKSEKTFKYRVSVNK